MRSAAFLLASLVCSSSALAGAGGSPVDALRDGLGVSIDLRAATLSTSGFVSINETLVDEQVAPFCAPKARGTLDIQTDLANFGFPASVPVTLAGTEVSPSRVRWDANVDINQCFDVVLPDGTQVNLLVRQVVVRLTADAAFSPVHIEGYCAARRGVTLTAVGGDAANSIDVTAYALCLQTSLTRVDIDVRAIAADGLAGDDPCPGDTDGDNVVNFVDLNAVLSAFGVQAAPAELPADVNLDGVVNFVDLNAVLSAFGVTCAP